MVMYEATEYQKSIFKIGKDGDGDPTLMLRRAFPKLTAKKATQYVIAKFVYQAEKLAEGKEFGDYNSSDTCAACTFDLETIDVLGWGSEEAENPLCPYCPVYKQCTSKLHHKFGTDRTAANARKVVEMLQRRYEELFGGD